MCTLEPWGGGSEGSLDLRLWGHSPIATAGSAGVPATAPSEFSLALGPSPFESIWKVLWEAGPCVQVHRAWMRAGASGEVLA